MLLFASMLYAYNPEVISIDKDFQWTVLKDPSSGKLYQARIGETVAGWKVEGITPAAVSVSKLSNGYILITRLPVPGNDRAYIRTGSRR